MARTLSSSTRGRRGRAATAGAAAALAVTLAACGGGSSGSSGASNKTSGVTITVALAATPLPKAALTAFTKQTGIKVKWVNIDWDSLQTKISAAATAKTYFADATDVDWSRVGQLGRLGWFYPMEQFLNTKSLAPDMPQIASFTVGGHVIGIPYDASFMVTTVNKHLFAKAGIKTMPTTLDQYTSDLKKLQAKGVSAHPLDIPFAAAEGLSTYWYETTGALGGTILDSSGKPQFTSPDSPGYKAAEWMIGAIRSGLVPKSNINVTDSQGMQTLMAKGQVASVFSDYSGNVGTLYNVPSSSSVVNQVDYVPTPGATGPADNWSNPDGIGIPKEAKYPKAAAKFISWFTSEQQQVSFAGVNGPAQAWSAYALPSHLSAVKVMATRGKLTGGAALSTMLATSKPVFPGGAPPWYPQFSNSVYTNLHAAAAGSETVAAAIKAIANTANGLAAS
ncbi:MAG TPA: extracellular solute-binding protein [Streptosporangiaceae bacterium]|nr:extracellular solute-binding protein [Streptosporangiaceae bacterium]